ncbi:MAG: right-handed parallel beta-helix repeat-containing protein, partial [Dermatophilaceae bacterium]
MTAANYTDGGAAGTGSFRRDTGWTGYIPAVSLTASAGSCSFSQTGDTITLLGDCTTDQTILVPDGKTLDGNDHNITAIDPTGGHFLGAVVENAGVTASVINLTVTADLATACDAFPASLAGIRLDNATGSITNNTVTGLQQGTSGDGCQEGNAIEVRNTAGTGTPQVTVTGNTVSDYQKTGVLVKGQVSAVVTGNEITGYGPVSFIGQNGIQVSFGATALVQSNTISNNFYEPESVTACGLIIYQADGVKLGKNAFSGNEKNLCNISRGGGAFSGL